MQRRGAEMPRAAAYQTNSRSVAYLLFQSSLKKVARMLQNPIIYLKFSQYPFSCGAATMKKCEKNPHEDERNFHVK